MPLALKEISRIVETHLPLAYQEPYDKSGLQVGDPSQKITKVLFTLDFCREVLCEAIKKKIQLIVAHHPLSLSDFKKIQLDTYEGSLIRLAIKNDIALYAAHTNHDATPWGLSTLYAKRLGLKQIVPLKNLRSKNLSKLVVYVPLTHTQQVLDALFEAGAGRIGAYGECSFFVEGTGTFKGDDSTNPFLGKKGERALVKEHRVEVIFERYRQRSVLAALFQAHPYEEVAYDIYEFDQAPASIGLGVVGECSRPMTLKSCAASLKKLLEIKKMRLVGNPQTLIKKIAFCNGSGASLMDSAKNAGADLFITGDVKYHTAVDAKRMDLCLLDVGHFDSEKESAVVLKDLFKKWFGSQLEYEVYQKLKNPFEEI